MDGQVPWKELGIEKELLCEEPFCRGLELGFRKQIYQWKNFPCDMVIEPTCSCPLTVHVDGFGLEEQSTVKVSAVNSDIASHKYKCLITSEKDVDRIRTPCVCYDRADTERRYDAMSELFDGLLAVTKRGQPGFWFAPWDLLTTWYGAQETLMDLAFNPDLLKRAIERIVIAWQGMLEQYQSQGLLSPNNENWCPGTGTGGPAYTSHLPQEDFDPLRVRTCDLWGSAAAQIFSSVSPEMHREFALTYEKPWLEQFGLSYYGCCEPLHLKIDILREISNLRKISMSPWADVEKGAQSIQDQYVFSWKPNPCVFAMEQWDEDEVAAYLRSSITLIKRYHCPLEIIQSDVSTIRCDPHRLNRWATIVSQIAEDNQD